MYLVKLVVNNFRAFYGHQVVEFAPPGERAVTVIHGENGAGKTNFLNALFWCLTGEFTPRLKNPEVLINRAAYDEDREAECCVELWVQHEGQEYQLIRTLAGRQSKLTIYRVDGAALHPVAKVQEFAERLIPKALSRWFIFDAEAIGEMELTGSEAFRVSLRRILGFELVDLLQSDLAHCLTKQQGALARLVQSKELTAVQQDIARIEAVLPNQRVKSSEWEQKAKAAEAEMARLEAQLRTLPQSKSLQDQRMRLTGQRAQKVAQLKELRGALVRHVGDAAPAILLHEKAMAFESQLQVKENRGRLPAPFSEQLVEDILQGAQCVCGRPIEHGSDEESKIKGLLAHATTSDFNARVRNVQFAIREIRGAFEGYEERRISLQAQVDRADQEIAEIDTDMKRIRTLLDAIDEDGVRLIEAKRVAAQKEARDADREHAVLQARITENEMQIQNLRLRYQNLSRHLGQGEGLKAKIAKIERLSAYVSKTLRDQELRALNVLQIELNAVLKRYLTKHFKARINPRNYAVELLDESDRPVGDSTGEGQVLKFAFISTVVALAGKKTQEKIDFLAEPTVAPLVLDAPFSALDPDYQSAVAQNLAAQTSQLVLLLSSAGWGEGVERALDAHVGRRYALISRQAGAQEDKPIKSMLVHGQRLALNEYGAERDESVIQEVV